MNTTTPLPAEERSDRLTLPTIDGLLITLPDPQGQVWRLRLTKEGFKRSFADFVLMSRDEGEEERSKRLERIFTKYYGHSPYDEFTA